MTMPKLDPESFRAEIVALQRLREHKQAEQAARVEVRSTLRRAVEEQKAVLRTIRAKEREARRAAERSAVQRDAQQQQLHGFFSALRYDPRRRDKRLLHIPLHGRVYDALYEMTGAKLWEDFSEMCYQLARRYSVRSAARDMVEQMHGMAPEMFYEFDHGETLGACSWCELFQSQMEHAPAVRVEWTTVPVVPMNSHDPLDAFRAHCTLTALALMLSSACGTSGEATEEGGDGN